MIKLTDDEVAAILQAARPIHDFHLHRHIIEADFCELRSMRSGSDGHMTYGRQCRRDSHEQGNN
jgi:hypothetical protein